MTIQQYNARQDEREAYSDGDNREMEAQARRNRQERTKAIKMESEQTLQELRKEWAQEAKRNAGRKPVDRYMNYREE
jgi:hypothetical protein